MRSRAYFWVSVVDMMAQERPRSKVATTTQRYNRVHPDAGVRVFQSPNKTVVDLCGRVVSQGTHRYRSGFRICVMLSSF